MRFGNRSNQEIADALGLDYHFIVEGPDPGPLHAIDGRIVMERSDAAAEKLAEEEQIHRLTEIGHAAIDQT